MNENWVKLWETKDNYGWCYDPRVNPGDADDPDIFFRLVKAEGDGLINKFEAIERTCRQMESIDVAHKSDELAKLPHRILRILGVPI